MYIRERVNERERESCQDYKTCQDEAIQIEKEKKLIILHILHQGDWRTKRKKYQGTLILSGISILGIVFYLFHRERDRQTDRQTYRQTDRQTDRDRDRETETETERQRETETGREFLFEIVRPVNHTRSPQYETKD